MNILVIGCGYVGLVTGTCFAEMGHHVTCLDIDNKKINMLENGEIPIFEPGLQEMLNRNVQAKRLRFTTDYQDAVNSNLICFLAVDTPPGENGSADLSRVLKASEQIAHAMNDYRIIVSKSTVPVGTCKKIREKISSVLSDRQLDLSFDVVSNPEFLKEGDAIADFMKPDRIIIGVDNDRSEAIMKELYSSFTINHERIIFMDCASSELSKYAANAMLATRISFMNELAGLCEILGADIEKIRKGIGSDQRIGYKFLYPGVGYGGSCFPKDVQALCSSSQQVSHPSTLIEAVEDVNQRQKQVMAKKVKHYFESRGGLSDKVIAILGLAFKPGTDDMRQAPSLTFIEEIRKSCPKLRVYDPVAMDKAKQAIVDPQGIVYCETEMDAARGADAVVLMTEWKSFRFLNFSQMLEEMRGNAFFDGRNQYKPVDMAKKGFDYHCIGRKTVLAKDFMQMKKGAKVHV